MDLHEAITQRRSIHDFKNEEIDEAILKEIFTLASWAPTHRMKEPWNIRLYENEGKEEYADLVLESYGRTGFFDSYEREKGEKMKKGIRNFLTQIPHHALIYMEKDADNHKYEEDYAAVCAFIQNTQLLAWERGIGVLWMTSPYLHDPEFIEGIGIDPSTHKLVAVLQMGYPERTPRAKRRTPIEDKLTFVKGKS